VIGRIFDGLFGGVFVLSAVAQHNDPDPLRWIAIYLIAAVAAACPPSSRWGLGLAAAVGIVASIWALMLLPTASAVTGMGDLVAAMAPDRPQTEAAREFGGLAIVVIWAVSRAVRPRD
jgi:hypothetical protein